MTCQNTAVSYHFHIWQVLSQLSCGNTCQICMWFNESNKYFRKSRKVPNRELTEQIFSNPHPDLAVSAHLKILFLPVKSTYGCWVNCWEYCQIWVEVVEFPQVLKSEKKSINREVRNKLIVDSWKTIFKFLIRWIVQNKRLYQFSWRTMIIWLHRLLNNCGLVTLYGDRELGQHWLREWMVTWRHQAITWTNVDLSSVRSGDIHLI